MKKSIFLAAIFAGTTLLFVACGGGPSAEELAAKEKARQDSIAAVEQAKLDSIAEANSPKDIVTTAVNAGKFSTLAKALEEAGLVSTLQGDGPFTVFAPTDAAFAALPAGALDKLLADKVELTKVLQYHVTGGMLTASDVTGQKELGMLNGLSAKISTAGGAKIEKANITETDIACSNGIIHVIDAVLIPAKNAPKAQPRPTTTTQPATPPVEETKPNDGKIDLGKGKGGDEGKIDLKKGKGGEEGKIDLKKGK